MAYQITCPSCQQEGLIQDKVRQPAHIVQSNLKLLDFVQHAMLSWSGYRRVARQIFSVIPVTQ